MAEQHFEVEDPESRQDLYHLKRAPQEFGKVLDQNLWSAPLQTLRHLSSAIGALSHHRSDKGLYIMQIIIEDFVSLSPRQKITHITRQ